MPAVKGGAEGLWEKGVSLFLGLLLLFVGISGTRFTISGYMKGSPNGRRIPDWLGRLVFIPAGIWVLYRALT